MHFVQHNKMSSAHSTVYNKTVFVAGVTQKLQSHNLSCRLAQRKRCITSVYIISLNRFPEDIITDGRCVINISYYVTVVFSFKYAKYCRSLYKSEALMKEYDLKPFLFSALSHTFSHTEFHSPCIGHSDGKRLSIFRNLKILILSGSRIPKSEIIRNLTSRRLTAGNCLR